MAEAEKKAAASEPAKNASADGAAAPARKSLMKRLLPYLAGGLLSGGLGVTAAVVTQPKHEEKAPETAAETKPLTPYDKFAEPFEIILPDHVTNLADPNQSVSGRFKIRLEVRVLPELDKEKDALRAACADKAAGKNYARIKDALGSLFSSKVSTDIKTAHGKEILKLELLDLLSPIIFPDSTKGAILNVYFEDFIVQ